MADQKISELNALTGVNAADDDALAIVDTSATETKKITRAQLFTDTPSIDVSGNITVSGTVDGRDVSADGTKLDGIEASADVTDATNVTAAGALMDSELTDIASVKALNQGVATTNSPTFAALTVDGHTLQDSTDRSGLLSLDTTLGTWRGIQIEPTTTSKWSLMGNQTDFGLYDDENGEWILNYNENSTLQLYSNGTNSFTVETTGATVTGNLSVTGTVDGRDVATDGTKLDGIESGATADQTAAEILTAIKTVDGSGSGLDADTVDGIEASSFLRSNATDTATGKLSFEYSVSDLNSVSGGDGITPFKASFQASNRPGSGNYATGLEFTFDDAGARTQLVAGSNGNNNIPHLYTRGEGWSGDDGWHSWYQLWHEGNDGSGSGLDADLLDGYHEGTFMRKSANSNLNMNNYALQNVNDITFNDPGPNEGLKWNGGNDWRLYESPDDLTTNGAGNLQFVTGSTRLMTIQTDGDVEITGDLYVPDQIIHTGDTDTYMQFDAADSWRVVAGGAEKLSTNTNGITITSATGNATFGSVNSTWFHMVTDRPNFYMDKGLRVNGTLGVYNQNTYLTSDDIYLNGILYHYGDTDTYMQFHNANEWRVVTGGTERLEVTDSNVTVNTGLKLNKEVTETVTALSGTSDVLEPQEGTIRTHTLSGNTTYTESFSAGQSMTLMIDDGAGYTVTWPTMTWVNNGGSAPTLATSGYTVIVLWKVSTTLYGALVGDGS